MATTEALEPQLPPVVLATDAKPSRATLAALFARAPPDFGAALVVLFIESFCMFSFFNVLMWLLIDEAGFNDRESGWIFATFGLTTAVCKFVNSM